MKSLNDAPQSTLPRRSRSAEWWASHRASLPLAFGCVLMPFLLFGFLAEDVWHREAFRWDDPVLNFLHSHATPQIDALMLGASLAGGSRILFLVLGVVVWLQWKKRKGSAAFLLLAVGGACLLNLCAKMLFGRTRPALWLSIAPEHDFGFPSGHSMLSMAVMSSFIYLLWPTRWRWPALIVGTCFVLLVGTSRLYLGVHFPSDVLAGWSASLAWVSVVHLLSKARRSVTFKDVPGDPEL